MKVELFDNTKKKKVIQILNNNYGITELPWLLIKTSKEKIRAYSGGLSWDELNELAKTIHIELVGMPLCSIIDENARINFDAINLPIIKNQIKENFIEITEEELKEWIKGNNIERESNLTAPFVLVRYKNDFFGVASNRRTFLQNYVPKERRIRN
jgi:NOL1/NOP2/fmu family ribosome biogenesis protein